MSSSFVKDCSDASAPASSNSMNSSCVPAAGSSAGNKTVFIIVNDSHIDQEQLSSILANHADASSEVSVLQMASGGGGMSAASDTPDPRPASGALSSGASQQQSYQDSLNTIPLESGEASGSSYSELALDAESLHQLESVLCTDEARHLLASDNLLDILTAAPNSSGSSGSSVGASSVSTSTAGADAGGTRPSGRGRGRAPPKRRSQRQQDKAEREEVTKILAENQRMLQREREELMAADGTGSQASVTQRELSNQQGEGTADEQHSEQEESEDDDDRSSDDGEQEDDDDENDKEVEMKKDQALKNARPVTARVAKTATRGRGRPRKYQSVALSGSGRGRGAPEAESGARGAPGAFKPGSLRGPRGRGRGRGMARGSKGKHMPVMVQEEEDDDDELPELSGPSGAPVASKATREDELDHLEKQLSDLHGGHDEDDDGDEVAPSSSPSAAAARLPAPAAKKIVFLKKGTIGMNKTANADKRKGVAKASAQRKSDVNITSKNDSLNGKEREGEKEEKNEVSDEDDDDEDEDDDDEEEYDDSGDDDYDPVKESAIMNAVDDATGNKKKLLKITSRRNSAKSTQETGKKAAGSPTKKDAPKMPRGPKSEGSPKKTIHRLIDKKGNVRYVAKRSTKSSGGRFEKGTELDKPKASPVETNYLKILQLAQKNVDDQAPKKAAKSLPDTKSVLKQMKEAMSENKHKSSISGKDHQKDAKDGSSTKSESPLGKSSNDSRALESSLKSPRSLSKPPMTPSQKKLKSFTTALDVPYASLKKNKIVKKFATGTGIIGGSKGREVAPPPKRKDDPQTYKDANKQLLHKLTSKLGKVSKNVSVTVDFVQNKTATPLKVPKSPTKTKASPLPAKYKEEFDEEDEELDDLEEYKPVEPVSSDNVRRSNRAPKKKSFGDEMIMLDEDDPHDELSDDNENEEQEEDENIHDEKPDLDEDDENKHTLKRRRKLPKQEMTTVNVEVVDEIPKRSKDEDFKFKNEDDEDEEQASSEDEFVEEDDPERLWCICQRPHNNRFMICCDGCEDWFHGSCVGITKAMGKQMEVEGKEWMCPNCRRASKTEQVWGTQGCAGGSVVSVGCRRSSPCSHCKSAVRRPDSLFCSDACILAHAATTLRATHEPSELSVGEVREKPALDQQVKDNPHVLVANNRTGQVLSGKNAPTLNDLSDFLKQNPDYSLVRPWEINARRASDSSVDKGAHEKQKPGRITINVSKAAAEAGFKEDIPSGASSAPVSGQRKTILLTSVKAPPNMAAVSASANVDEPNQKAHKKQKAETPQPKQTKKRSRSESESSRTEAPPTPTAQQAPPPSAPSVHDIRRNVRKALTDSLLRRCEQNRSEFPDHDKGRIEELVKVIEEELFVYFNKSVNFKYKSRYRSLVFNIRDEKNGGLFRQIVTGAVTPQKLATMTSDEMASKELAEWRQTQGKKELEAIQKHELDMLSLGNTYIMKSHKGEIEIDKDDFIRDKEKARETVMLPEEEPLLEEVTGSKSSSSAASVPASTATDASKDKNDKHSSSRHKRSKDKRRESDRDRDRDRKHSRDDDRESSSRKRSRRDDDDSRKRRRHSDNDRRDRDRDKDDRHKDRDHKERKRHDSDRHRHDSKSDRRDRKSKNDEVSTSDDRVERRNLSSIDEADEETDAQPSSTVGPLPGEPSYDQLPLPANISTYLPQEQEVIPSTTPPPLEDDPSYIAPYSPEAIPPESPIPARNGSDNYLLDSPQTPPLVSPSSTPPPPDDGEYSPSAPPYSGTPLSLKARKSKSKRSSVAKFDAPSRSSVDSIAIWRGMVQMTDVAKFSATAFEVSGGSVNFTQDVPESIDIVGRISPDNVWNYIADTKKAASKEILVVRFQPTSEEEKVFYIALYSYLSSKKRYGVVGNCDKTIKDFYIIPLASHQPIPQVLLPLQGPGFEEQRPHMLVGVVVRTKPKRIYDAFSGTWKDLPDPSKLSEESSAMLSELKEASERSFTPPLPGAPYDPEEAEEEQERSATPDLVKPSPSVLELLPDSPVIATPPGAPDDDGDSDADIIEVPSNKAAKRPKEEEVVLNNKKTKTDLSKEQESMLAELNRQIEQHKKELNAMHESINKTKEKETEAAVREEDIKAESSNIDVDKKVSDPVKLDTSRISIPDNLHIILEGIKRKEEEIKQKQAEIVRRKNEALGCGGGDTDMRRMLPQPLPFSSAPSSAVQEMRPDTSTAPAIPKAFSGPVVHPLPPPATTMMPVPPIGRLGEGLPPPPRPLLHPSLSGFDMQRGPPPGIDARPPHPRVTLPPRPPGPVLSQPLRPPPPRPYLDPHKVPSSPIPRAFPASPGPRTFLPHPPGPPPLDAGHNMVPSPAPHSGGPPRGAIGPPPPPRAAHPGHPPRGFGPPSNRGGPPPHMARPPLPYRNNDDQFGHQYHHPSHEDFEFGHRGAPGHRPPPRDDHHYREDSYNDYHGYPADERNRRYSEETPPLEHEGFDHRRGNRDWNGPRPWKGRGRGDWERRGGHRGRW